jgi:hypothetical protein
MHGNHQHSPSFKRRRAIAIATGAIAVLGVALSASALGGVGSLAGHEGEFCHVIRDCVYPHAPNTRIESGPLGFTDNPRPRFEFASDTSHVTFECRMDDQKFHACPKEYQSDYLSNGQHQIQARAVDEHGNVDPTPAALDFVVDTHCPSTEIEDHPGHVVHDDDVSFTFDSSDRHAHFRVWLDGKRIGGTSSHVHLKHLRSGTHTLSARAVDKAGNSDQSAAKFTFKVKDRKGHRHGHHGGHGHN